MATTNIGDTVTTDQGDYRVTNIETFVEERYQIGNPRNEPGKLIDIALVTRALLEPVETEKAKTV